MVAEIFKRLKESNTEKCLVDIMDINGNESKYCG